jgi:hypothetical protein
MRATVDGRTINVEVEEGDLVLTEKTKRNQPPNVVRMPLLSLFDGNMDSAVDVLLRKLPIADLSDIQPAKLGYELKVRLLALCKPKQEIDEK